VAQILGFNERTIRRDIGSMSEDVRQMSVECPTDVRHMSVTEYGLKWLADKHNVTLPDNIAVDEEVHTDKTASMESELVFSLLEQLRQKDLQLAEKDKQLAEKDIQIGQLIEQSKNYQVLLRGEQERSLLPVKSGFFSRLFHRNS
jgi:cell envelope opacity-associated protein A